MINIFFHNKYTNFDFDQVSNSMYEKDIDRLLALAPNEEVKRKLHGILYEGGFDNFTVNSNMTTPDNPQYEMDRRLYAASLLISDPKLFDTIAQDNIILFHGTNSNALESIIKNGMLSEKEIINRGEKVVTGEYFASTVLRGFISFTDNLGLALHYASLRPSAEAENQSSYGALIGISTNNFRENNSDVKVHNVISDTPEIGIVQHLPVKYIKLIAVPENKIPEVQKMVEANGLTHLPVVPAEGIVQATMLTNLYYGYTDQRDKNCLNITKKGSMPKFFNREDLQKLEETRKTRSIQEIFSQIKSKFKDLIDIERDSKVET